MKKGTKVIATIKTNSGQELKVEAVVVDTIQHIKTGGGETTYILKSGKVLGNFMCRRVKEL